MEGEVERGARIATEKRGLLRLLRMLGVECH